MTGWLLVAAGLLICVYAYFGYPALVLLRARLWPRPPRCDPEWQPRVTACLPCHNEEQWVGAKLDMLLAQDYPSELLDIQVLDDGSTDGTAAVVEGFADRGVKLLSHQTPGGKAAAINTLAAAATGDVLLMVDARQRIEPCALSALLDPLADPRFGAVSGELVLEQEHGAGEARQGLGMYWRVEKALRRAEARVHSSVGVSGALYAIRRELMPTLPPGLLLDDLAVPLAVARQGFRVGFAPEARAYDRIADPHEELGRKLRTLGGNMDLPLRWPWVLNPLANRICFAYLSHKLCRLAVPYALGLVLAGTLLLPAPWRWVLLAGQLGSWGLGGLGLLGRRLGQASFPGRLPSLFCTFYSLNLAALLGPWLLLTGRLGWKARGRCQAPGRRAGGGS